MGRIYVVDDNEMMRESLAATLASDGHEVVALDSAEAMLAMAGEPLDLLVTDLKMPRMDGVALLQHLRQAGVEVPVILMTAHGTIDSAVQAMRLGAFDYITKPFDGEKILALAGRAIAHGRLQRENEVLRAELSQTVRPRQLVGASLAMRRVSERIALVAGSQATVLIQGESGTGKEVIARAIHAGSTRRERPMLAVNCAALSKGLLESELFGHEKGAFTGADKLRRGRFELADGGTLLLDEISEMDMPLQAKLLRVLQERTFERVGSSITRKADVRVLVTTNRDLKDWVAQGKFRPDLYYRLNVVPINVPPLREHAEDIAPLAEYFNRLVAQREGRAAKKLDQSALAALRRYRWPGNVRELENIIERANVLSEGPTIAGAAIAAWLEAEFPGEFMAHWPAADGSMNVLHAAPSALLDSPALDATKDCSGSLLAEMERRLILQTLQRCGGHRARTAGLLGIGLRTLTMKLKQYRQQPSGDVMPAMPGEAVASA